MSTKPIIDYLTKEVTINRNIVTFRLLSRQFSIHVNEAKNELLTYHTKSRESEHVYAIYLVSGDVAPKPRSIQSTDDSMDIDEDTLEYDDGEEVPMSTMVLVSEKELGNTKASLVNIRSCHVYCLSPSPLRDAGLICDPTYRVREIDNSKGNEFHKKVGRIISPEVKLGKGKAPAVLGAKVSKFATPAAASNSTAASTSASRSSMGGHTFRLKKEEPKEEVEQVQKAPASATTGKTKITAGTLNWNKAKPKATVKDEPAEETQLKSIGATTPVAQKAVMPKEDTVQKRGAKRKSDVMMQSGSRVEVPAIKPPSKGPVVKKGVVVSEDEDEDEKKQPNRSKTNIKGKQKVVFPDIDYLESEKSLRAMMDIDDSEVIKVSRSPQPDKREEEEEPVDENAMDIDMPTTDADETGKENDNDMDDDTDPAPKTKPKTRKPKKVIPVGRNSLKKKRVVKSRMTTDEKGYMVTEDYSEYESVDEEEAAEPEAGGSKTSKGKAGASAKGDKTQKPLQKTEEKKSMKPVGSRKSSAGVASAGGGKKNLMNYFGGANKT